MPSSVLEMSMSCSGDDDRSGLYTVFISRCIWSALGWMRTVW